MRSRRLLLLALFATALAAACTDSIPEAPAEWVNTPLGDAPEETVEDHIRVFEAERAEIRIEGATVYHTGVINGGSAYNFLTLVRDAEEQIDTLIINSGGGETRSARRIGRWIHEHGVTVVVEELCFSSCVNYIFTTAPKKVVRDGAYVGWHGSEQQARFVTVTGNPRVDIDSFDVECNTAEQIAGDEQRSDGRTVVVGVIDATDEIEFLDQIGVSVDALLYGIMLGRCDHYFTTGAGGWTFSIDDMAQFGIDNVIYEGDHEYPGPHRFGLPPLIVYDLDGGEHRLLGAQP